MAETTTLELISPHRAGTVLSFVSNRAVNKGPKFTAKAPSSLSPRTRQKASQIHRKGAKFAKSKSQERRYLVQIRLLLIEKTRGLSPSFVKKTTRIGRPGHLIPEGSKPLAGGKRSATTGGSRRDSRRRWSVGAGSHSTFDSAAESAVDDGNPTAFPSPTAR